MRSAEARCSTEARMTAAKCTAEARSDMRSAEASRSDARRTGARREMRSTPLAEGDCDIAKGFPPCPWPF
jgi:hypothetical protein